MKVLLVDDHPLVLSGLESLLGSRGIEVSGRCSDARELVKTATMVEPDLVISDIIMPGPCVIEQCRALRASGLTFKICFLSAHLSDFNLLRCLDLQAEGILSKEDPPEEILAGIDQVLKGETYVSRQFSGRIKEGARIWERPPLGYETLTSREHEVLKMIGQGLTIRDISHELDIAIKTVDRHRSNIMAKLGMHSQIALARYAIREGLVAP